MANRDHVAKVLDGVEAWNAWRRENAQVTPDLRQADLDGRDLARIDFRGTQLWRCSLARTNLRRANLSGANFRLANLSGACLEKANLRAAALTGTDLTETDLTEASFWRTLLCNVDLSTVKGLETVKHYGPSTLGLDTLLASGADLPIAFLQGVGLPDDLSSALLDWMKRGSFQDFYSCFISYSHEDKTFARVLHDSLQKHGIRCWLDEHQLLPGDDILEEVQRGIMSWDKILLCCSQASLTSWWVDSELETAFEKERRLMQEGGRKVLVVIPIDLDGYLFSGSWQSGKEQLVKSRLVADFREWETNHEGFETQVERLVQALRADSGGREGPPTPKL